ncbi:MAG: chromate transporter [Lagierella massiliensis]|nr:chromate transporter [Lagierella massiliensis]
MIFLKLFMTFFKIGLFSFGGGYAMIPLITQEVVMSNSWINKSDFINIISISQITPGPIAINIATFIGFNLKGLLGSITATISVILPSIFLVSLMFIFLRKFRSNEYLNMFLEGIKVVIIGLIGAGFMSLATEGLTSISGIIVFILSFYAVGIKKINPIPVIVLAGIIGIFTN